MFVGLFMASFLMEDASADAAVSTLFLRDDPTGGDCLAIGNWNASSKTCTLTTDPTVWIVIANNNLTLDGDGHTIVGLGPSDPAVMIPGEDGGGEAVLVEGRTGVTVKNLILPNFDYSVHLSNSHYCTVSNVTTTYSGVAGISLRWSTHNTLIDNHVTNTILNTGICIGYGSSSNTVMGNTVISGERGIYLHDSSNNNVITGNTIRDGGWALTMWATDSYNSINGNSISNNAYGAYIHGSSNNNTLNGNIFTGNARGLFLEGVAATGVYNNSFIGNTIEAVDSGGSGNSFSLARPDGGNYWSSYDSEAEGCVDSAKDGFCDNAYQAFGVTDSMAWVKQDGWVCTSPQLSLGQPEPIWATYVDYLQHRLSIRWPVNNDGNNTVYNAVVTGCMNTNGVMVETPLPLMIGDLAGGSSTTFTLAYSVPMGVGTFRSAIYLTANDRCHGAYDYPAPLPTS
ncbi:MAG: right-handed parallel beta-helix repeat-containing protein [Thermoleophilia bacterium]